MIQSGLYAMLVAAPSIQALLPVDSNTGASLAKNCIHFVRAPKEPQTPFIVIHMVNLPPAASSLDGVSELIEGEFQFDCYASDDGNGALVARQLAQAVRLLLENYSGTLPDGTTIAFYEVTSDFDDNYETGGQGYLFRSVLRLQAFYSEAGLSPPPPPPISDMAQTFHWVAQAGDNAQQIKASPGFLVGAFAFSAPSTSYAVYIKFFDSVTRPNPAGGDIPKVTIGVEAGTDSVPNIPRGGLQFTNGIWMLIVKGIQDNNDTAVASGDISVDVYWQ
jgi:Protein of unknown function (DUF3168)